MISSKKSKRHGTISALIKRRYHAGTRLAIILVLALTIVSVVIAQAPILNIYLPIILKTLSSGQASADTGSTDNSEVPAAQQDDLDCNDPNANHGKKMKCKHQKLTDAICATSELANDDDSGIFTDKQKERFAIQCNKSQAWVDAPGREADFGEAFKKRNTQCYVEEIIGDLDDKDKPIGDDDGICTKGEQHKNGCVEDDLDNIGDNDGVCEELNKKKGKKTWEACLVTCDVEGSEAGDDPDLIDTSRAELVENAVDDAAETLTDLNTQLENMTQELRVERGALTEQSFVYSPTQCMGLLLFKAEPEFFGYFGQPVFNYDWEDRPFTFEEINGFRLAANYVQAGEICDDALSMSFDAGFGALAGSDTQAWCTLAHYADYIVQDAADAVELLDDLITGTRIDNAVQCLETVAAKLNTVENTVNNIENTVNSIQGGVDEANLKLDTVLDNHDKKLELRRVHLQVTELKEKSEFLVGATEAGHPVSGVEFISVKVADSSMSFVDVTGNSTISMVEPGMYWVVIDLPKEANNAEIFAFEVRHNDESGDHYGFTHFHRRIQNNPGSGQ